MTSLHLSCVLIICTSSLFLGTYASGADIKELRISSYIRHRFADTNVTCLMHNGRSTAEEAIFTLQLPESAFISNFSMLINGELRVGEVKDKDAAAATYNTERAQGRSTGLVAKARDSSKFSLRVTVAANSDVVFQLQYQEALKRVHGFYQHKINFNPGQVVDLFDVQVSIDESRDLSRLLVPRIRYNTKGTQQASFFREREISSVSRPAANQAEVTFAPTREEQAGMSEVGIVGQFIVRYDVFNDGADIEMIDGHYVHFFHPDYLEPFKKAIVFVLDDSGSMSGRKIAQLRDSMDHILNNLRSGDKFSVVAFSSSLNVWNSSLVDVHPSSIRRARQFTSALRGRGGTNINDALLRGCQILSNVEETHVPIIVFLTDGHPSASETNTERIIENVERANTQPSLLYTLAYGSGADFDFLKKLSNRNYGFAKKIYEDNDASEQLQDFFFEIENPLLRNVEYTCLSNSTSQTSLVGKKIAFSRGGDMIFHGKLDDADSRSNQNCLIKGKAADGKSYENYLTVQDMPSRSGLNQYSLERLWAYVTINDMLKQLDQLDSEEERNLIKSEIVLYSLQYNFVTPLTSLVVTQGNSVSGVLEDESSPANSVPRSRPHSPLAGAPGHSLNSFPSARMRGIPGLPVARSRKISLSSRRGRIPMVLATVPPPTPPPTLRPLTTTTTTTTTRAPLANFINRSLLNTLPVESKDTQFRVRRGVDSFCFELPVKSSTSTILLEDRSKAFRLLGAFGKSSAQAEFPPLASVSIERKEEVTLTTGDYGQHVYNLGTGLSLHVHNTASGLAVDLIHPGNMDICNRYEGLLKSSICSQLPTASNTIKPRWPVSEINEDTCTSLTPHQLGF